MKLIILPTETRALDGWNRKLILTYADLLAWTSATAQAVVPVNALGVATITNPANVVVEKFLAKVTTAFTSSGGAITSLGLTLGDGGSVARLIGTVDLKATGYTDGASLTNGKYLYTAADTIDAVATIVGQTMASLITGQVEIMMAIVDTAGIALVDQP